MAAEATSLVPRGPALCWRRTENLFGLTNLLEAQERPSGDGTGEQEVGLPRGAGRSSGVRPRRPGCPGTRRAERSLPWARAARSPSDALVSFAGAMSRLRDVSWRHPALAPSHSPE